MIQLIIISHLIIILLLILKKQIKYYKELFGIIIMENKLNQVKIMFHLNKEAYHINYWFVDIILLMFYNKY
jgi:hypothetical protein